MYLNIMDQDQRAKELSGDEAFAEIERCMYSTLETYANVHRGAGFKSLATTAIYEQARNNLLDFTGLDRKRFELIFCHPGKDTELMNGLSDGEYMLLSSAELDLPLGVRALAVERTRLAALKPPLAGGGTVDLVSPRSVVWSGTPARSKTKNRTSTASWSGDSQAGRGQRCCRPTMVTQRHRRDSVE